MIYELYGTLFGVLDCYNLEVLCMFSVINTPDGFLHEWWSIFNDVYTSRHQVDKAEASATQVMIC